MSRDRTGPPGSENKAGPPRGWEKKAGQQARPNDARPVRPSAPPPLPPTSEGKKQ